MPKSYIGPAVLATGFVIVSCAFAQELNLKTCTIQTPTENTTSAPSVRQSAGSKPLGIGANTVAGTVIDANSRTSTPSETTDPISVSIASPAFATVNVAASTINVSGTATGGAGITQITWQTSNGATGVATGASSFVATGIPVLKGTTTIVIRAYDSKGAGNWVALVAVHP